VFRGEDEAGRNAEADEPSRLIGSALKIISGNTPLGSRLVTKFSPTASALLGAEVDVTVGCGGFCAGVYACISLTLRRGAAVADVGFRKRGDAAAGDAVGCGKASVASSDRYFCKAA